ncbi:MAG TPA: YggS family pyridoxal phosphate-dependent enzyme [Gammaproteobacteria bacterium]|nr:YggS family pyridoxal phosphate-dependent enzyme [Gammaproteobacteria bacterium]
MGNLADRLTAVRRRITAAEVCFGRPVGSVRLLAVSKTWPADRLREAAAAGQRCFGESYAQEALTKMTALEDLALEWHFIGPIQSNKTRDIAARFQWVHGVDRPKIARRLAAQRPVHLPPLQVCIQVNISGEASKSGVAPGGLAALADELAALPRLRLRGLMAIPAPATEFETQRTWFRRLRLLQEDLIDRGHDLDTLSMGMTRDLEAAIAEGATIVRVGTGVFGVRGGPFT